MQLKAISIIDDSTGMKNCVLVKRKQLVIDLVAAK